MRSVGPGNTGERATNSGTRIAIRAAGLSIAAGSIAGAAFIIAKLYTGRGVSTPIRAALHEQPLVALLGLAGASLGIWLIARPNDFTAARMWLNPRWVWRERKGEASLLAVSALLGLGLLEVGSRALYAHDERLPFFHEPEYLVYPPLYHAMRDYDPDARNVLLLGGSVMYGAGRGGELERRLGPPWRIYNLAQNAHGSLDSLAKYRYLLDHGYRFDYVILYEAINEVRANNAPPEVFRADYSHYLFYRLVHAAFGDRRPVFGAALRSDLFFRAERLVTQLRETRAFGRDFVNVAYPREDWLRYGAEIKSAKSFEANLLQIAKLAKESGARLIVGQFAYDPILDEYASGVPSALSRDEMVAYTKEWGLPENVRKGIIAHNEVMRRHADSYEFVSTGPLKRHGLFIDPCHFTREGERVFIEFWVDTLSE